MTEYRFGIWLLLIVGLLCAGAFVVLSDDAGATYYNVYDSRDIRLYYENLDSQSIYLGDKNINFDLRVLNGNYDLMNDDSPIRHVSVSIATQVHDEDGKTVDTPVARWNVRVVDNDATIYDGNYVYFYDFEFNVKTEAKPMRYNFTVVVDYETDDGLDQSYKGYIHWSLYPTVIPYDFPSFYPGVQDQSSQVRLDVRRYASEMELTLQSPSAVFTFWGDQITVMAERPEYTGSDWYPTFLISVDRYADAGEHKGAYTLHYKNPDGVRCTETGEIVYRVNNLAMMEVRSSKVAISQGTTETTLALTVRNTGNARLYDVELAISSISSKYIWRSPDHYEGGNPTSNRWIYVGDVDTWSESTVEVNFSIDQMVPQGVHRLMFDFRAVYKDHWSEMPRTCSGSWTSTSDGMVPRVVMDGTAITLALDNYDVTGMDMRLKVVDDDMDVVVTSVLTPTVGLTRENVEVAFTIENVGDVDYRDVTVKMLTDDPDSPFHNPSNLAKGFSEAFTVPGILGPGDSRRVSIYMDIAEDAAPGTYDVLTVVTADEVVGGYPVTADLTVRVLLQGDGPVLRVRAVSPTTVTGDQDFTLTLTIDNIGDDTARKVILGSMEVAEGEVPPFEPVTLPLYLGDMVPGNTTMAQVRMHVNPGMADGCVHSMVFSLDYVDSQGDHPSPVEALQEVSVRMAECSGPTLEFRTIEPETVTSGQDFTLSIAIFNIGGETARNVVIGPGPGEGVPLESHETPPEPLTLPIFVGDIEPDRFAMVDIPMRCNADMVEGRVYAICLCVDYTDTRGDHPPESELVHQVSVKTKGSGETTETTMYSTGTTLLYVLTFCVIAIVAIYAVGTGARIYQNRSSTPRERRPREKAPPVEAPPAQYDTQQQYYDQGAQGQPVEADVTYDQQVGYDQAQYPEGQPEQAGEQPQQQADTESYYERQLWGGDQGGGQ